MQAEILSTGDEVRTGAVVDTNAAFIAEALETIGITVNRHTCVGDDSDDIAAVLREIAGRSDLAVITGGLGPTTDDRTAEAAARAAGVALEEMRVALEQIERFFHARGMAMSAINRKQALMPQGALVLENTDGTAPGFRMTIGACRMFFLPGVPREMRPMLARHVVNDFTQQHRSGGVTHAVDVMPTFGLPESVVGDKLKGITPPNGPLRVGLRVLFPEIDVRVYGQGDQPETLAVQMRQLKETICERLGKRVLSTDGKRLPEVLGGMLMDRRATLAVAESCTGGLMAKQLTDVPGSSGFFLLSAVTYANEAKIAVLGVAPETLERYGAVDEATAREMAEGARRCAGADYALSTTGIAGPDGGTAEKPVGTVCIGLATPEGTRTFRYVFPFGDRDLNRRLFAATAFDRLRQYLMGTLRLNGSTA